MSSEEFPWQKKPKISIQFETELENINDSMRQSSIFSFKDFDFDLEKLHRQKESLCQDLKISDSMLIDKIDHMSQLFEGFDPKNSLMFEEHSLYQESFSYLNTSEILKEDKGNPIQKMMKLICEQDKIIDSLQLRLMEKDEQIDVLEDELVLCRSNLANMQKQMKELKKIVNKN
jgi:hypothetical protein